MLGPPTHERGGQDGLVEWVSSAEHEVHSHLVEPVVELVAISIEEVRLGWPLRIVVSARGSFTSYVA